MDLGLFLKTLSIMNVFQDGGKKSNSDISCSVYLVVFCFIFLTTVYFFSLFCQLLESAARCSRPGVFHFVRYGMAIQMYFFFFLSLSWLLQFTKHYQWKLNQLKYRLDYIKKGGSKHLLVAEPSAKNHDRWSKKSKER